MYKKMYVWCADISGWILQMINKQWDLYSKYDYCSIDYYASLSTIINTSSDAATTRQGNNFNQHNNYQSLYMYTEKSYKILNITMIDHLFTLRCQFESFDDHFR